MLLLDLHLCTRILRFPVTFFFFFCQISFVVFCVLLTQEFVSHTFSIINFLVEKQLVEEVRNNDTLIIVGETGSGKTTRKFSYASRFLLAFCEI